MLEGDDAGAVCGRAVDAQALGQFLVGRVVKDEEVARIAQGRRLLVDDLMKLADEADEQFSGFIHKDHVAELEDDVQEWARVAHRACTAPDEALRQVAELSKDVGPGHLVQRDFAVCREDGVRGCMDDRATCAAKFVFGEERIQVSVWSGHTHRCFPGCPQNKQGPAEAGPCLPHRKEKHKERNR